MENPARITTLSVIEKSKFVKINHDEIRKLARKWVKDGIKVPEWPREMHLDVLDDEAMITYLIILDSLNFCFWNKDKKKKWRIRHKGKEYGGYFALSLALRNFFEKYSEKANFLYFSNISFKELAKILKGRGEFRFLKERWEILKAVSGIMIKKYKGSGKRFIESASGKLSKLVPKISEEIPFFGDFCGSGSHKIYFWKRAQILPIDIYGALGGRNSGFFEDLDYVTAFADYKVPQILRHWGILEYAAALAKRVDNQFLIKAGSAEEIEIRAATIWAVEYLKEELYKHGKRLYSFEIDWVLWTKAKEIKIEKPYHLTKTVFY